MPKSPNPAREVLRDARTASLKMILESVVSESERGPLLDLGALNRALEALKGKLDVRVMFDDGESLDISQALLCKVR